MSSSPSDIGNAAENAGDLDGQGQLGQAPANGRRSKRKLVAFVLIAALLALASWRFGWAQWVAGGDFHRFLESAIESNYALACVAYFAVSTLGCVVLALPGVLFAVVAGALFGPVVGTLLCWLSMWVGACGSFLAGRYFLKDALKPKLRKNALLNRFLFEGADRSDAFMLAITRLVPVFPFNLQNFAYGVTDIRFSSYALYSALFMLPGTAAYTVGAAGVVDAGNRVACLVVAAALFAVSLVAAALLKRKAGIS